MGAVDAGFTGILAGVVITRRDKLDGITKDAQREQLIKGHIA